MLIGCTSSMGEYKLLAGAGYDYAELPCRAVAALDDKAFSVLRRDVEETGLPVSGMNAYCPPEVVIAGPGFQLETARKYAGTAALRAEALGCRLVGVGSPKSRILPEGYDRRKALGQLHDFLRATADIFGYRGVTVCFEALAPCFCNFVNRTDEAAGVVERAGHPFLGLVVDFYNMEQSGEGDLDLAPYLHLIRHAHISDGETDPTKRCYLRKERYPVHAARIASFARAGYEGTLTVEIDEPLSPEPAAGNSAFLRRACAAG